jgi:hypothetical protein
VGDGRVLPQLAGAVIGIGLTVLAASVSAQVRYVDETGGVHWVQSESQVPVEYRDRADHHLPSVPSMPQAGNRAATDGPKAASPRRDLPSQSLPAAGIAETRPADPDEWQPPAQQALPTPRMIPLFSPWGYQ